MELASARRKEGTLAAAWVALCAAFAAAPAPARPPQPPLAAAVAHARGDAIRVRSAARVYAEVDRRMRRLAPAARARVARVILSEAQRAGIDPLLVVAVIGVESSFDARAVSPAGAVGLMQLLGSTMREEAARARLHAADPLDPAANVQIGVRYLRRLVSAFDDVELALMAYNAGPTRVRRHLRDGGIPARLLSYPRRVDDEMARLRDADAGGARRLAARALPAHASRPFPELALAVLRPADAGVAARLAPAAASWPAAAPAAAPGTRATAPPPPAVRARRSPPRWPALPARTA